MGKKILSCVFIIVLSLMFSLKLDAVIIDENESIPVNVTIRWIDYDNHFNERPDEINLNFNDLNGGSGDRITVKLKVTDSTLSIDPTDPAITIMKGQVSLPKKNSKLTDADWQIGSIEWPNCDKTYNLQGDIYGTIYSGIDAAYLRNLSGFYKLVINWDDDNNRDDYRDNFVFTMTNNNNVASEVRVIERDKEASTWKHDALADLYLPQYLEDPNSLYPIWDPPINYTVAIKNGENILDNYQVDTKLENGTVTINFKHEPNKLQYDVPVKIIWEDVTKIPEKLKIRAYCDDRTYKDGYLSESTNWEYNFTELLENDGYNKQKAVYTIQVEDKENYSFEVSGNQEDGFIIIGTEEEINKEPILDDEPKTGSESGLIILLSLVTLISGTIIKMIFNK